MAATFKHALQTWALLLVWLVACSSDPRPTVSGQDATGGGDGGLPADCDQLDPTYADYVSPIIAARCLSCHSANLTGTARNGAPDGMDFDREDDLDQHASLVLLRTVEQRSMPPGAPFDDCEAYWLGQYLTGLGAESCQADCTDRVCGSDGCSGTCGGCDLGQMCDEPAGQCVEACTPACEGLACGDDGCGGSCGTCGSGLMCGTGGSCVCEPACTDRTCGEDGCGGSCGDCSSSEVCGLDGGCLCIPDCSGKLCGDDGCGGACGTCPFGQDCDSAQTGCECVPDCSGRVCGPDGCGGTCVPNTCPGIQACFTRTGTCGVGCSPDCSGRECGDDGCGGTCGGGCSGGEYCDGAGQCQCQPDCLGNACGDDGCGASCGTCAGGLNCTSGQCDCSGSCTDRECGSDGCGGDCGSCDGDLSCSNGACVEQCVPDCDGKSCGADGCGGSCGTCPSGQSCDGGGCGFGSYSFGSDVYPILSGCGSIACHGGVKPAEGLDLSSESKAFADLVGVDSTQCSGRKRVKSGDPDNSYLVNKLTGVGICSGSKMPKIGAGPSASEVDTIRGWIGAGAAP